MALPLPSLAVAGPGLIGGSLALAARAAGCAVVVWTPDPEEAALVRASGLSASVDPATLAGSDLVALCVPPEAVATVARKLAPHLSSTATVTEVASVKAGLGGLLRELFGERFVSCHPMAGTAYAGFGAARPDLFAGRRYLLLSGGAPQHAERLRRLWQAVGSESLEVDASEHDWIVAQVSHLPVLVASALIRAVGREPGTLAASGPGLRDTTRVAGSPPALWRNILTANRACVLAALERFSDELTTLRAALAEADGGAQLQALLAEASALRSDLTPGSAKS